MTPTTDTKLEFARALERLMERVPLEKISVTAICAECGSPRQTFYYHFRDKYDLIAWVFTLDSTVNEQHLLPEADHLELMKVLLDRMWARRGFYRKAFGVREQNSLRESIHERNMAVSKANFRKQNGADPDPREVALAAFALYGGSMLTIDWITGKVSLTSAELAKILCDCMLPVFQRARY